MSVAGYEEVVGLDVAVHDADLVGRVEPAGDVVGVLERAQRVEAPAREALGQRLADQELHDEEEEAVVGLVRVEEAHDVLVVEVEERRRLGAEARRLVGVVAILGVHDLQRDGRGDVDVPRFPDRARVAGADEAGRACRSG